MVAAAVVVVAKMLAVVAAAAGSLYADRVRSAFAVVAALH